MVNSKWIYRNDVNQVQMVLSVSIPIGIYVLYLAEWMNNRYLPLVGFVEEEQRNRAEFTNLLRVYETLLVEDENGNVKSWKGPQKALLQIEDPILREFFGR